MSAFELEGGALRARGPLDISVLGSRQGEFMDLAEALLSGPEPEVVLDLTDAGRLASTAIGLCVAVARQANERGKRLVVRIHRANRSAVALTGLQSVATLELTG
jgi:ABC-type transporter Mla MlaB component